MAALPTLKTRRQFLAVAGAKQRFVTPGLVLQVAAEPRTDDGPVRVGYTASKKVGNAVARNRAKRRLRALANTILPLYDLDGRDVVLIARAETVTRPFTLLRKDLQRALGKLGLGVAEMEW
jgi:ribonuclease P protein component